MKERITIIDSYGEVWHLENERLYHVRAEKESIENNGICGIKSEEEARRFLTRYGYLEAV